MPDPDPDTPTLLASFPQVGFLNNFITQDNIEVGDYTYYDDVDGVERLESNVLIISLL